VVPDRDDSYISILSLGLARIAHARPLLHLEPLPIAPIMPSVQFFSSSLTPSGERSSVYFVAAKLSSNLLTIVPPPPLSPELKTSAPPPPLLPAVIDFSFLQPLC
jgi:hypothetical protein